MALYGSWRFNDNPDPTQITIANSYVRYWLPLYVLATPFTAGAIIWLSQKISTVFGKKLIIVLLMSLVVFFGVQTTFFSSQDGLLVEAQFLKESKEIREDVFIRVPENAVIIVDRADKIFFPDRRVLYPLRAERTFALMPTLVHRVPLYYYGITLPATDLQYLNEIKLASLGLRIELEIDYNRESLYRIFQP